MGDQLIADALNIKDFQYEVTGLTAGQPFEKFLRTGRYERAFELTSNLDSVSDDQIHVKKLASLFLLRNYHEVVKISEHYLSKNPNESNWKRLITDDYAGAASLYLHDYKKASAFFAEELKFGSKSKSLSLSARAGLDLAKKCEPPPSRPFIETQQLYGIVSFSTGIPMVEVRPSQALQTRNNQNSQAQKSIGIARSAEDKGDYESALKFYSNAVNLCPDDPQFLSALASCQISAALLDDRHRGYLKSAKNLLEKAIKIDSNNWQLQNNLAACCFASERYDDFKKALIKLATLKGVPLEQSMNFEKANDFVDNMRLLKKGYNKIEPVRGRNAT